MKTPEEIAEEMRQMFIETAVSAGNYSRETIHYADMVYQSVLTGIKLDQIQRIILVTEK